MPFKPYDYQLKAINEARQRLAEGHKSVLIQSPAGSGKSVIIAEIARMTTEKGGRVLFLVHRRELIAQIYETFIADEVDMKKVLISTPIRVKNKIKKRAVARPALIITDETHHSLAESYRMIYSFFHDVPRLGFTATPWRMSGKGFKDIYEVMVEGPQVAWLIQHNRLSNATIYAPNTADLSDLKKSSTGDFTAASMDKMAQRIIFSDVVDTWKEKASGLKTIVYCHAIDFSKQVADWFNQAGIPAQHADSKTPQRERDRIMADFKSGKIQVLCNVDLVSEGFNVPDCSCVVMLRPTESLVLYIQQSMRCMRYKPGKQAVIIDQVGNVDRFGVPQQDRQWTLEDREKKKQRSGGSSGPAIKTCPQCFAVVPARVTLCPMCGHIWEVESDDVEIKKEAKLEKIDTSFVFKTDYLTNKKPSELKSVAELKAYAEAKGYKKGWVYFQQKQRGWIK